MHAPTDPLDTNRTPTSVGGSGRADALDDALDRLSDYRFTDGLGLATHGPMGAEAVSTLGHDEVVAAWVEAYKSRHEPIEAPPRTQRLEPEDESWRPALGDPGRLTDWEELFARELRDQSWQEVLQRWVPRLLSGYGGAFTHGLIRTAHAVRAAQSTAVPSAPVSAELATGLAYWAGSYKELPGQPRLSGTRSLEDAISRIPRPDQAWTPIEAGQFTRIDELSGFPEAVDALGPPASVDEALSDLTATFARMMVTNPDVHPFALVHAVTPVAGARTLLPYLSAVSTAQVYAHLWQVNAAITAGFVPRRGQSPADGTTDEPPSPDQLVAQALEHQDPHVVKFTEACLREHSLRPDPVYLLAARHVIERTPAW